MPELSVSELIISESDAVPARLILYSNLPITCQGVNRDNSPAYCWIKLTVRSSDDIAVRQRTPYHSSATSVKSLCTYQLDEDDWRPDERYAYDGNKSLDIVAKVDFVSEVRVPRNIARLIIVLLSLRSLCLQQ